jgi:hypothetical protein
MRIEQVRVVVAGVLAAAIGVMHQTRMNIPARQSIRSAVNINSSSSVRPRAQPITRRE